MKAIKKIHKSLVHGAAVAAVAMAPQVLAHGGHSHNDAEARILMLENQLQLLKQEIADLKAHSQMHHEKVMELEEWKEQAGAGVGLGGDNMVFFRGGYAHNDTNREHDILTSGNRVLDHANINDGFYIGAGLDFGLSRDLFGLAEGTLLEGTDVIGEVMFEYKRLGFTTAGTLSFVGNQSVGQLTGAPAGGPNTFTHRQISITQFTLTAAPKIKFLRGSAFRPWIIPVGLGIHVISPPSDGVTVLNPGLMFGAGAEYNLWKNIHIGADVRYHLTANADGGIGGIDGTNTDGLTAGGYIGFGF